MAKHHLKRMALPRTWKLERKEQKYITRANPGAHTIEQSMPVSIVMRHFLKCAKTRKEVKHILESKTVLVDGKKIHDDKRPVGLMDVITLSDLRQSFRVVLDRQGCIAVIKADHEGLKPCKIIGKTLLKGGKFQINLSDSRNIQVDKNAYAVGDTLMMGLPDQKVTAHYPLEKGASVYLVGGKHIGTTGMLEEISGSKIKVRTADGSFETLKAYAFVVGKEKPALTLEAQ